MNNKDYYDFYKGESFEDYQVLFRRKFVIEQIKKYNAKRILEIGCGLEPLFTSFEEDVEFTVVEPIKEFFFRAGKHNADGRNQLINDYFDSDFKDKYQIDYHFDMIICSAMLHEADKPDDIICGMKKLSNVNTVVHINVPNSYSMHRILALESGLIKSEKDLSIRDLKFGHSVVYDINMLKKLVQKNGIDIIDYGSYFIKPFSHEQMLCAMKEGIINTDILEGLYNMGKYLPEMGSEIYINGKFIF